MAAGNWPDPQDKLMAGVVLGVPTAIDSGVAVEDTVTLVTVPEPVGKVVQAPVPPSTYFPALGAPDPILANGT